MSIQKPTIAEIFAGVTPFWNQPIKTTPISNTSFVTRTLPGGATYQAPTVTPTSNVPVTPKITPASTTPMDSYYASQGNAANPMSPAAWLASQNQGRTPPAPTSTQGNIPPQFFNPKTGALYSPAEFAEAVGSAAPQGQVPQYAGNALMNPNQSVEQLQTSARGMANVRNDMATGETDPYKAATASGIAYSPSELKAIESAYAGIYDPVLNDVFNKLDAKEKEAAAALEQKNTLEQMAKQFEYDKALKGTPTYEQSTGGISGGVYVPGQNPAADSWAQLIFDGRATIANVPSKERSIVAAALASFGNQADGRPTTTELGKQKLVVAKELLDMFDKGQGISTVGQSRLFGGGIATPGSPSSDFYSKYDQLAAMAQLDASKFLKGQGQVSDAERQILANAATSLKPSQSEELFRATLVQMIEKLEGNIPGSAPSGGGEVLRSPDGTQEVNIADLTPEQVEEAKTAGWQ